MNERYSVHYAISFSNQVSENEHEITHVDDNSATTYGEKCRSPTSTIFTTNIRK